MYYKFNQFKKEYYHSQRLAETGLSEVDEFTHLKTKEKMVSKKFFLKDPYGYDIDQHYTYSEIYIHLLMCKNPFTVPLKGVVFNQTSPLMASNILMPKLECTLSDIFEKHCIKGDLPRSFVKRTMKQILIAISHMHR